MAIPGTHRFLVISEAVWASVMVTSHTLRNLIDTFRSMLGTRGAAFATLGLVVAVAKRIKFLNELTLKHGCLFYGQALR